MAHALCIRLAGSVSRTCLMLWQGEHPADHDQQEVAKMLKEINNAKKQRTATDTTMSLQNPSTTAGLHVNAELVMGIRKQEREGEKRRDADKIESSQAGLERAQRLVKTVNDGKPLLRLLREKGVSELENFSNDDLGKLARNINVVEPRARVKLTQKKAMLKDAVLAALTTYPRILDNGTESGGQTGLCSSATQPQPPQTGGAAMAEE